MIRISGGVYKGHSLQAPKSEHTRPTSSKTREALFNALQGYTQGARVLDLYAGSGALGYEALSRGAESVVFVESDRRALHALRENQKRIPWEGKKIKILPLSVEKAVSKLEVSAPFDLIFADPPYRKKIENFLIETYPWTRFLAAEGGLLVVETGGFKKGTAPFLGVDFGKFKLEVLKQKQYSETFLTTFQRVPGE